MLGGPIEIQAGILNIKLRDVSQFTASLVTFHSCSANDCFLCSRLHVTHEVGREDVNGPFEMFNSCNILMSGYSEKEEEQKYLHVLEQRQTFSLDSCHEPELNDGLLL